MGSLSLLQGNLPDLGIEPRSPALQADSLPTELSAGNGRLTQSGVSLVAQLVKNPPAMQETWVGKIPLEKGKATHSSILSWRIPLTI